MYIEEKEVKTFDLKKCKSVLRKLNQKALETKEEIGYMEDFIEMIEYNISKVKARIKKLTMKK